MRLLSPSLSASTKISQMSTRSMENRSTSKQRYWNMAKNMLQKYGHHILSLRLDNNNDDLDLDKPLEFYKGLQACLECVPNLTTLEFVQRRAFKLKDEDAERKLKAHLQGNPLPQLSALTTLHLVPNLGSTFTSQLLRCYGSQLTQLKTAFVEWLPEYGTCSSLKELSIYYVTSLRSLSEQLLTPMKADSLKKLDLNLHASVTAKQLFDTLQPFEIQALRVSIGQRFEASQGSGQCDVCPITCGAGAHTIREVHDPRKPGPGILASVKAFELNTVSPFMTFQFLKFMPSLKYLGMLGWVIRGVVDNKEEDDVGKELAKCSDKVGDAERSKIWKILPALKQLRFDELKIKRPASTENPCVELFDRVFPQLFCDLKRPEYQKLRRVCKPWKTVIDTFVQNHPIARPFTVDSWKSVEQKCRNYDCHVSQNLPILAFSLPSMFANATQQLKDLPGNPFIGRALAFQRADRDVDGPVTADKFWNAGTQFLEKFGEHVWYFHISPHQTRIMMSELYFYKILHRCLTLMPNLRSLEFDSDLKINEGREKDAKQLSGYIQRNPLPVLKHLETFFTASCTTPEKIQDAIFEAYGKQLKRLEITRMSNWKDKYGRLPNLTQLNSGQGCCAVQTLVLLSLRAPMLQRLEVAFQTSVDEDYLFELIQRFDRVKVLTIILSPQARHSGFPEMASGPTGHQLLPLQEGEKRRLFPEVEQLYIRACHSAQSFQFLKSFPNLRRLNVRMSKENSDRSDDIGRELRKCMKDKKKARESKIWEKMPHLENILLLPGTKVDKSGYVYVDKQWSYTGLPAFNMATLAMYLNSVEG